MQKIFLICFLLLTSLVASFSQESGPREPESKTETTQRNDQISQSGQQPTAPPPAWIFEKPSPPIVNVYTRKHAGEESHCAQYKNWKEWGSFALCRSLEWIDAERVIAIWTIVLGIATFCLYLATRGLVKGARNDFTATHRPWIRVAIKVCEITNDSSGMKIHLEFHCYNTGTTPALDVSIAAEVFLVHAGCDEQTEQRRICNKARLSPFEKKELGRCIFPDEIPNKDFPETDSLVWAYKYPINTKDIDAAKDNDGTVLPVIVGCADYRFSFGKPDHHQTWFAYHIRMSGIHARRIDLANVLIQGYQLKKFPVAKPGAFHAY